MPPPLLLDLSRVDPNHVIVTREEIYESLPQRFEFMQLDGILLMDTEAKEVAALRRIRIDEWWVKGHIPGRPIFPGVLMVEAAAQLAAYYTKAVLKDARFIAFGGIDQVKFREAVSPPADMLILGRPLELKRRKTVCAAQGIVEGRLVFEAKITGLPM